MLVINAGDGKIYDVVDFGVPLTLIVWATLELAVPSDRQLLTTVGNKAGGT